MRAAGAAGACTAAAALAVVTVSAFFHHHAIKVAAISHPKEKQVKKINSIYNFCSIIISNLIFTPS